MKSFNIYTFGCRVNEAESEKISLDLSGCGWRLEENNPDYYLINTCAVTAKAEREVRQLIYQVNKKHPGTKIVLTGCAATYWEKKGKVPQEVELVINNDNKNGIVDVLVDNIDRDGACPVSTKNVHNKFLTSGRSIFKIQTGCNRFCTYCLTAYLRGKPQSVKINQLVKTINNYPFPLQEVVLAAINTAAYGVDTGENLIDLIKAVLNQTKINRLSFGSIHPWSFNQDFFQYYQELAKDPRFVQFFHLPIQSGSNAILKLMRRDYSIKDILSTLKTIKTINPYVFVGTDIIVGFCGETEKEFSETCTFLEEAPIDKFHVFRFSKRPDTAACLLSKDFPEPSEAIKTKRAKIIRDLGQKKYLNFLKRNIGRKTSALVIKRVDNEYVSGLLDNQLPILIRTKKKIIGKILPVMVDGLKNSCLLGRLLVK